MTRPGPVSRYRIRQFSGDLTKDRADEVATEEPLEIRLLAGGVSRTIAVTMRTPGADFELAAGFLYGEGIARPGEIEAIGYCTDADLPPEARYNTVSVRLPRMPDIPHLERHFLTSSACGVCGTASLDALKDRCTPIPTTLKVHPETLYALPAALRDAQSVFTRTGGLHAAGLFTPDGTLIRLREDIGRHNAVDKLIGWALLNSTLPLTGHLLLVSGRAGYEIAQKALTAGIELVCSVSAPSSLAVDLARQFDLTLIGFLRDNRFNIYSSPERVDQSAH